MLVFSIATVPPPDIAVWLAAAASTVSRGYSHVMTSSDEDAD